MSWPEIARRYDVVERDVALEGGAELRIAAVRDINALVDALTPDEFEEDDRLPYWATLWPSAKALASALHVRPPVGPMLELGAGLGLVSVAAAAAGVDVLATDFEPDALAFIKRNAELNQVEVATRQWDWRDTEHPDPRPAVVAADVLYEERNVEPFMNALERTLAPGGTAIVADPGRPHVSDFGSALMSRGFTTDIICTDDILIMYAMRNPNRS